MRIRSPVPHLHLQRNSWGRSFLWGHGFESLEGAFVMETEEVFRDAHAGIDRFRLVGLVTRYPLVTSPAPLPKLLRLGSTIQVAPTNSLAFVI
eukprot:CAMPEP_0194367876 /NCGR_PEP_ID=MMETSP0174-20130528/16054_1 /TAXON_ID=216777 /ORGANISM="Proboscia alata, Strain PI-D3" /LENGTH=92 /DNA_ID=CAMNT_0039143931 /DNA_START=46 /DNA_END=324 /DNA_ORIENTATION=-